MPADCQINECGVLAVGRCAICHRAFCPSHQALQRFGGGVFVDLCGSCQSRHEAAVAAPGQTVRGIVDGAAARLQAHGVPQIVVEWSSTYRRPVRRSWIDRKMGGEQYESVKEVSRSERGWFLGEV